MPQVSRLSFFPAFVLIPFLFLVLVGCDEGRFGVPKKSRVRPGDINKYKRMLPASVLKKAQPSKRPVRGTTTRPTTSPSTRPTQSNNGSVGLEFLASHAAAVKGVAFDPSGTFALSIGADRQLILWNLLQQKKVRSWYDFQGTLKNVQFSPDGRRFLVLESPGTLSLWSRQGKRLQTYQHKGALRAVQFAPLDNRIAATTAQGKLLFLHSFRLNLLTQEQACPNKVSAVSLSIDSGQKWVVVGCANSSMWLRPWDQKTTSTKKLTYVPKVLALSSQGTTLAVGTETGHVALWKVQAKPLGLFAEQRIRGHVRAISGLVFHPNLPKLASSSLDKTVAIWTVGKKLSLLRMLRHEASVESLAYSPASGVSRLLTGEGDGSITLWKDHGQRIMAQSPPVWKANTLSFSPKANQLATDAGRGGVLVWDLTKGTPYLGMQVHPFHLIHIAFAQDGNHFISADRRNIAFWDLRSRRSVTVLNPPKKSNITAVTLGRDWTQAFYGTDQRGVHLWTVAGPKRLFHDYRPQCVTSIALHPLSRQGAVGTCEGILYLYNFGTYRRTAMKAIASSTLTRLQFSADGKQLLVLTAKAAAIWQVPKLKKIAEKTFANVLLSGTFIGKTKQIALTGGTPGVHLWTPGTKKPLSLLTKGCDGPARGVHFPAKKPYLAVACLNGQINLWDKTGKRLLTSLVGLPNKQWLAFTPKKRFVASVGAPSYFYARKGLKRMSFKSFQQRYQRAKSVQKSLVIQRTEASKP